MSAISRAHGATPLHPSADAHANLFVLDVRTPMEFQEAHVPGSINIPLYDLECRCAEVTALSTSREVAILCRTGQRAESARQILAERGITGPRVLEGGILTWQAEGLPLNHGPKSISLERQVRITAGLFILIGVGLGTLLHPGFVAIPAFVGAGLAFSGITDTCGMGTLLSRAPWNRR